MQIAGIVAWFQQILRRNGRDRDGTNHEGETRGDNLHCLFGSVQCIVKDWYLGSLFWFVAGASLKFFENSTLWVLLLQYVYEMNGGRAVF